MPTLVLLCIFISLVWHLLLPRFWYACLGATLSSTLIVWVLTISHFGWMDSTFFRNLALTVTVALTSSIVVGLVVSKIRRNRTTKETNPS